MTYIYVTEAQYHKDYQVKLRFSDGAHGIADLKDLVARGGVFEPLRDPKFFQNFTLDQTLETIAWPNGADVAPESLRARIQ